MPAPPQFPDGSHDILVDPMLVHSCVPNYRVSEVMQRLDTYLHNPEPPQDLIQIGDHTCIFDGPR
ncbi:hypothetical protein SCLCIDRAFT_21288 [Scleroderma citrinum Foug A]|uniref:Uncharacterized protein n=1 Tax=Scleroderma citrinum Foug A TaxID=1036808 RepID=A0A0C3EHJ3_9AGAM|nr:hypothetical protein SCLCIDRAFT_21288 [Scleroderma citrinum Foug A]